MTRFWRRGFYRTNMYGTTSWVEGHLVDRDDWDRSSLRDYDIYLSALRSAKALESISSRYVVPNATCPVCGDEVFFYQNDRGSRVFFDEIGPPWPKHPCTDNKTCEEKIDKHTLGEISPELRLDSDISVLRMYLRFIDHDLSRNYISKFKNAPPQFSRVLRRLSRPGGGTLLILSRLDSEKTKLQWLVECAKLPQHISDGSILVSNRNHLSFFDFKKMEGKSVSYTRVKSAADFLKRLASKPLEI